MTDIPPSVDVTIWCPEAVSRVQPVDSGRLCATLKMNQGVDAKVWFNSIEHLEAFVASLLSEAGVEYFTFDANPYACPYCDEVPQQGQAPLLVLIPVDSGDEVLSAISTD